MNVERPTPPDPSEGSSGSQFALKEFFLNFITYLASAEFYEIHKNAIEDAFRAREEFERGELLALLRELQVFASKLLEFKEECGNVPNFERRALMVNKAADVITSLPGKLSYQDFDSAYSSLIKKLSVIFNDLGIKVLEFTSKPLSPELQNELRSYIATGALIHNQSNSNVGLLDQMAKSVQDFFRKDDVKRMTYFRDESNFSSTFIALVAPSFDGKTQSAFAIRSAKVLYFVTFKTSKRETPSPQPIYQCFHEKSWKLRKLAIEDYLTLLDVPDSDSESFSEYESLSEPEFEPESDQLQDPESLSKEPIEPMKDVSEVASQQQHEPEPPQRVQKMQFSASWLVGHSDIRLNVLGYWFKLMQIAKDVPAEQWMEAYANLTEFKFRPLSIDEFNQKRAELGSISFCIFLDEFSSKSWSIYSRNLARAVGIPCIVANTNSRIANLVGASQKSRKGPGEEVWSAVLGRLNQTLPSLVEDALHEINMLLNACIRPDDPGQKAAFDGAFIRLFSEALANARPGIAELVVDAVKLFNKGIADGKIQGPCYLAFILERIGLNLERDLVRRKPNMSNSEAAMLAKCGLLFPTAYNEHEPGDSLVHLFKYHRFMEDHLFYLINPISLGDLFVTVKTSESQTGIQIIRPGSAAPETWKRQFTRFFPGDFFGILASLFIPFNNPVFYMLNDAYIDNVTDRTGVSNVANQDAIKLPGNPLEVATAVAIADSSQHLHGGYRLGTLAGVNGNDFVRNLISNCFKTPREQKYAIQLEFTEEARPFDAWLSSLVFPFLYSVDREDENFSTLARIDSGCFITRYRRTGDSKQIDGIFKVREGSNEFRAVIECKNYKSGVDVTALNNIMTRVVRFAPRLAFVFCSYSKPPGQDDSALIRNYRDQVNFLQVEPAYSGGFQIAPYSQQYLPLCDPSKLTVLIFSLGKINRETVPVLFAPSNTDYFVDDENDGAGYTDLIVDIEDEDGEAYYVTASDFKRPKLNELKID